MSYNCRLNNNTVDSLHDLRPHHITQAHSSILSHPQNPTYQYGLHATAILFYIPQKNYLNSSCTFTKHLSSDRHKSRPRTTVTLKEQFTAPTTTSSPTAISLKIFAPNFVKICRPVNSWKRDNHSHAHTQCAISLLLCLKQRHRVKMCYFSDGPLLQAFLSWIWYLLTHWSSHVYSSRKAVGTSGSPKFWLMSQFAVWAASICGVSSESL